MLNREDELNLARAGDKESFSLLYDAYVKKIYDYVYYKTLNKEVSEDLASQVFLKALKNVGQFKSDNFSAWLYTIARNVVIDYYRTNRATKNIEDCWDLASEINLTEDIDDNLKLEKIRAALKKLKSSDRELLMMRLWSDYSFKEIAQNLGKKESAVKVSFGRALNRLKKEMPLAIFLLISLSIICKKMN